MKPSIILILLFLAVLGTTILYSKKFAGTRTPLDLFAANLSPVHQQVPRGEVIRFVSNTNDPMLFMQCQFVVAPHVMTLKDSFSHSWTLYADRLGSEKTPVDTTIQTICWQLSDSLFAYCLTVKKAGR